MTKHRDSFVEGIGDDFVFGILLSTVVFVPLIIMLYFWQRRPQSQTIHPESQSTVQDTRNNLPTERPSRISNRRELETDITCPICIGTSEHAVETNCGHVFCGTCMVAYWQHGRWHGVMRCPVCRQTVTLLLLCFTEEERNANSVEKADVIQQVKTYNRRFSGEPRDIMDYIRDLPTLLRHCVNEFFSLTGLVLMFRMRIVVCFLAALLYFISPLDLIPEAMFGLLGFLDDFFVLLLLGIYVSIMYRQFVANRDGA